MRGQIKTINSRNDMTAANVTDEQIITMATQHVTYDDAKYPADYDKNVKAGEEGYIPPVLRVETEIDQGVLQRFGITLSKKA